MCSAGGEAHVENLICSSCKTGALTGRLGSSAGTFT